MADDTGSRSNSFAPDSTGTCVPCSCSSSRRKPGSNLLILVMFNREQNGSWLSPGWRNWQTAVMERHPCVYILASKERGTLYVGVTADLAKRAYEHKNNLVDGFTKRYRVHTLVWYEQHQSMISAISREKATK
ncbi:MAG: GIY-YIG nuclease family protein [Rhodanobacteraceae bacterium]